MKVLDLASGTGEPAVTLAARVGPAGHVTALDLTELENCSKSPPSAPVTGASRISRPSRPTRNPCRSPPTASIWAHAASVSCSSPTWNAPSVNCTAFSTGRSRLFPSLGSDRTALLVHDNRNRSQARGWSAVGRGGPEPIPLRGPRRPFSSPATKRLCRCSRRDQNSPLDVARRCRGSLEQLKDVTNPFFPC